MTVRDKIYAIVPARSGSKGVEGKNVRLLAGFPLIAYSIAVGLMCDHVDRVVVSTDSESIAELARSYGAETPFLRPADFSGDLSPDRDFVLHALNWFGAHEHVIPDYLVHLRPTTPLRDPILVDEAISTMLRSPRATSLRSGHEASESPFKWFMQDDEGYFRPIGSSDASHSNLPRQLFQKVYVPDGYVDVLKSSFVLQAEDIHGDRMIGYVSPMCCEVDTTEDFNYLEFMLSRSPSPVLEYLKSNYRQG
jgi:CMP-N,N'-diacetyllegionaminic acid synthase